MIRKYFKNETWKLHEVNRGKSTSLQGMNRANSSTQLVILYLLHPAANRLAPVPVLVRKTNRTARRSCYWLFKVNVRGIRKYPSLLLLLYSHHKPTWLALCFPFNVDEMSFGGCRCLKRYCLTFNSFHSISKRITFVYLDFQVNQLHFFNLLYTEFINIEINDTNNLHVP